MPIAFPNITFLFFFDCKFYSRAKIKESFFIFGSRVFFQSHKIVNLSRPFEKSFFSLRRISKNCLGFFIVPLNFEKVCVGGGGGVCVREREREERRETLQKKKKKKKGRKTRALLPENDYSS